MSMLGGVMRSQWGTGSAEFKEPAGFDSYVWADRPASAAYDGKVVRITDIGPSGGSLLIADGTYWKPVNGIMLLAAATNLALSTTSSALTLLPGWSLLIPAGLFQKPGAHLQAVLKGSRTGTLNTGGIPGLYLGWGTGTGQQVMGAAQAGGGAGQAGLRADGVMSRVNDTQVRVEDVDLSSHAGKLGANDSSLTGLKTLSATTDVTLNLYGRVSSSPGAGETITADSVFVTLFVP